MKFELQFNCDSACFDHEAWREEIANTLKNVAREMVGMKQDKGSIVDRNGNVIGEFKTTGY